MGISKPSNPIPSLKKDSLDFPLNEALTNLYVGSAAMPGESVYPRRGSFKVMLWTGFLSVLHLLEQEVDYFPDPFGNERRLEKRYPRFAEIIGDMIQGYDHVPESALRILNFIEEVYLRKSKVKSMKYERSAKLVPINL